MSRKYESLIALNTSGNENSVEDLTKSVGAEIEAEGAKLDEIQQLGKREFAYNARHLEGGHYVNFIFEAEPDQLAKIQDRLKLNKTVHIAHYQRLV